jgi:glycosyltransferase involved in cell wall biosynthesis
MEIPVLHIHKVGGIAGSENHLLALLPRLPEHGYRPVMLVLADRDDRPQTFIERLRAAGIETHLMPVRSDIDPTLVPRLVRFMRRGRYPIVHTHLLHADLYGRLAARLTGTRVVISSQHCDNPFQRTLPLRLLSAWSAKQADHIICISECVRQFMIQTGQARPEKTTVIHYGLTTAGGSGDRSLRQQRGWSETTSVIGMVARLTAQKGHSTLLDALPQVLASVPEAQLVLVGDGELRDELAAQAVRLGVADHIHFLGHRADAATLMRQFDLFAHPSRWEGFGLVFLEAMAAALPVVATRVSAIPEIVVHDETGLLVPADDAPALADALTTLLLDRTRARAMGQAGHRRLLRSFTPDKMVASTGAIYDRFMKQRHRSIERGGRRDTTPPVEEEGVLLHK